MPKSLLTPFFFFITFLLQAQTKFVPTVIALYPGVVKVDSIATAELKVYEKTGVVTEQLKREFLREGLAPNWKTIREKELAFMDPQDFWSMFALSLTRELTYHEIENRNDFLIYPARQTTAGTVTEYKKIADQNKVSWVVNFVRTEILVSGDKRMMTITVQLYNVITNRIYLDKIYTADSSTLAPSETCADTLLCMAEVIRQAIVVDLADKIEKNIRHERTR